ncbi:MAG: anti-sigma factor [bacterium]|jgi:anti-sigma factor (TIGR02949 family)|nr:anti-sigma factor [bacterium]
MANSSDKGCGEYEKCLKILRLMLDNEASQDEEEYLNSHIDSCIVCFEEYNLEKEIRELLRSKVNKHQVPGELVTSIRNKIIESV